MISLDQVPIVVSEQKDYEITHLGNYKIESFTC